MSKKELARKKISKLVAEYEKVVSEGRINSYNEENTKKDFILPLFRALGWNVDSSQEVSAEDRASKGRVDYGFRLNGMLKFVLEAKPLRADLNRKEYAEQAIDYAWHKSCTWAVLTDFEGIKLFNAWKKALPHQCICLNLSCRNFDRDFEDLWLLSRDSFESGAFYEWAKKYGRGAVKRPVGEQLLADFIDWRALLSKDILKHKENEKLIDDEEDMDEAVQRLLDRLVFIRNCEDRGFEEHVLNQHLRDWLVRQKRPLHKVLDKVFVDFEHDYDSKLFKGHLCDQLKFSDSVLQKIIEGLYDNPVNNTRYDFALIDADILGSIYENYLGYILKKTAKRAKVTKKHAHRKEMGIYYTPVYIVDYIVRNTLGKLLEKTAVKDIPKIKVLDPACGSGSFLIKAFDVLCDAYEKKTRKRVTYAQKKSILINNLYGVDLDPKAVEIAQLNLLLKAAEKKKNLPILENNIKCGNSLIDDENVAGDKAFVWDKEFPQIMKNGGFDVVVGNPPYVSFGSGRTGKLTKEEKTYFFNKFPNSAEYKISTYALFIDLCIEKCIENGMVGLIIPDSFLMGSYFSKLRKFMIDTCLMNQFLVFEKDFWESGDVGLPTIIILQKEANAELRKANLTKATLCKKPETILNQDKSLNLKQSAFDNNFRHRFRLFFSRFDKNIVCKVEKDCEYLEDYLSLHHGIRSRVGRDNVISSKKEGSSWKKGLIASNQINRYSLVYSGDYINVDPKLLFSGGWNADHITSPKILIRRTGDSMIATIDENGFYHTNSLIYGAPIKDFNINYLLSILNSNLMKFYYYVTTLKRGRAFPQVEIDTIKKIPIKVGTEKMIDELSILVDKIIHLKEKLRGIGPKQTSAREKLEKQIKETDDKIDQLVYKIYGITKKEQKIIEESLK